MLRKSEFINNLSKNKFSLFLLFESSVETGKIISKNYPSRYLPTQILC